METLVIVLKTFGTAGRVPRQCSDHRVLHLCGFTIHLSH